MLSGPDLGAGFLHQLSIDRDGETTTFTFHAQAGGADANGPPKGPLDVFGAVHPPHPCMFGGPRCWHRRFLLPLAEAPRVRAAYNRNRFVLETMVAQAMLARPVPVAAILPDVVARLTAALDPDGVEWYIGGSAGAQLLGAPIAPRDIDVGTTREGVDRVGGALREFLIEPVAPTDWPKSGVVRAGRAFVGTFQEGARVEWAVPIDGREPARFDEWSGRPGVARLETARCGPHTVRVSRPEYDLVRAAESGRADRVAVLAPFVRDRGADQELLAVLLARSSLAAEARRALERAVAPG
jgi:hypothetical protein